MTTRIGYVHLIRIVFATLTFLGVASAQQTLQGTVQQNDGQAPATDAGPTDQGGGALPPVFGGPPGVPGQCPYGPPQLLKGYLAQGGTDSTCKSLLGQADALQRQMCQQPSLALSLAPQLALVQQQLSRLPRCWSWMGPGGVNAKVPQNTGEKPFACQAYWNEWHVRAITECAYSSAPGTSAYRQCVDEKTAAAKRGLASCAQTQASNSSLGTGAPPKCGDLPDEPTQRVLRQYGIGLLGQLGPVGAQGDIFLYHMGHAVVGQIEMILNPGKTLVGMGQAAGAVMNFVNNDDPGKWIPLRDQAINAINQALQNPAATAGELAGSGLLAKITGPLLPVRPCPASPTLTAAVTDAEKAADRLTKIEKAAAVPGNSTPVCGAVKEDCFWRAMRNATGNPYFDQFLNGRRPGSWGEVHKILSTSFGGKVPGVPALGNINPANLHDIMSGNAPGVPSGLFNALGIPNSTTLDDIITRLSAPGSRGAEGIIFVGGKDAAGNSWSHAVNGANIKGYGVLIDDQKQFWSSQAAKQTVQEALRQQGLQGASITWASFFQTAPASGLSSLIRK